MPENVPCPVCDAWTASPLFLTRDRQLELPGSFSYVRCTCGAVYLNPRPTWEERLKHYEPNRYLGYYDRKMTTSPLQRRAVTFGLRKRWRLFAPFVSGSRLLDVGCGSGGFLRCAPHTGWQTFGVERNPGIGYFAGTETEARISIGDVDTLAFPDQSFDVVMLWTVLEHTANPRRCLEECVRVLHPGGMLVVQTVTQESWSAQWFGSFWVGLDAPRVLTVFSKPLLKQMLAQVELQVVKMGTYFYDFHPFLWSFRNFCRARVPGRVGQMLGNLPHAWWLQAITLPFFAFQKALGGNSFVTVLARKP